MLKTLFMSPEERLLRIIQQILKSIEPVFTSRLVMFDSNQTSRIFDGIVKESLTFVGVFLFVNMIAYFLSLRPENKSKALSNIVILVLLSTFAYNIKYILGIVFNLINYVSAMPYIAFSSGEVPLEVLTQKTSEMFSKVGSFTVAHLVMGLILAITLFIVSIIDFIFKWLTVIIVLSIPVCIVFSSVKFGKVLMQTIINFFLGIMMVGFYKTAGLILMSNIKMDDLWLLNVFGLSIVLVFIIPGMMMANVKKIG